LNSLVSLVQKSPRSREVNLPPPVVIGLPTLPIMRSDRAAMQVVQETLPKSVFAVSTESNDRRLREFHIPSPHGPTHSQFSIRGCRAPSADRVTFDASAMAESRAVQFAPPLLHETCQPISDC
jgi:hypothetical protein